MQCEPCGLWTVSVFFIAVWIFSISKYLSFPSYWNKGNLLSLITLVYLACLDGLIYHSSILFSLLFEEDANKVSVSSFLSHSLFPFIIFPFLFFILANIKTKIKSNEYHCNEKCLGQVSNLPFFWNFQDIWF